MSRLLAAALLNQPAIIAIVGNRIALKQLKAGTALPALVYTVVDVNPTAYVNEAGYETMRLQINPLAETAERVQQIHDAAQAALDGLHGAELAGCRVIAVRRDTAGPEDITDADNGHAVWTWPRDYIVIYE